MGRKDEIRKELKLLTGEGFSLANKFSKDKQAQFLLPYQDWYSKAVRAVAALAPDRIQEFRSYYEIDPKRKSLGYGTYVIQDYFKNVIPSKSTHWDFDPHEQVLTCLLNQLSILNSLEARIDSVLANIETELYAELQDNEIVIARQLAKVSLRAAGALMGVVIEGHLQKVAHNHGVKVAKKNPTIADLNDPLKNAGTIDTPTWRKITLLSDLRNLCSHKKDADPTKEQVEELIRGAEWLIKTVF